MDRGASECEKLHVYEKLRVCEDDHQVQGHKRGSTRNWTELGHWGALETEGARNWEGSKLGGLETGSQILAALGFDRSLRSLSLRSLVYLGTLAQSMTREPPAL